MRVLAQLMVMVVSVLCFNSAAYADEASSYYRKALAYKRQGNVDQAIDSLKKALELRENYAAAHQSLGILYRKKNKLGQAIQHLKVAARLESKSAEIQYSLGLAYLMDRRVKPALKAMRRAAALKPKDAQIQAGLGTLLIREDPKQATVHLLRAVKAKPNDHEYVQQLGLAFRKAKKFKQAEKYLLKSASMKEDASTEFNLGVLYRRMEKSAKAVTHYEEAIRLDPKMAPAFWDVAHMYTQLKRHDDAIKAYEHYLELKGHGRDAPIARKRIKELKQK